MEARHGSTTAVNAGAGVITNTMCEHSRIIGPTLNDVAKEKAGVIHLGSNIIVGMGKNELLFEIFKEEAQLQTL